MAPLGQRILKRGLLFAAVMAAVGFLLARLLLAAARHLGVDIPESEGINLQGPVLFALIGFAIAAAAECVRRK